MQGWRGHPTCGNVHKMHPAVGSGRHQAMPRAAAAAGGVAGQQGAGEQRRLKLQMLQAAALPNVLRAGAGPGTSVQRLKALKSCRVIEVGSERPARGWKRGLTECTRREAHWQHSITIMMTEPSFDTAQNSPFGPKQQSAPMACSRQQSEAVERPTTSTAVQARLLDGKIALQDAPATALCLSEHQGIQRAAQGGAGARGAATRLVPRQRAQRLNVAIAALPRPQTQPAVAAGSAQQGAIRLTSHTKGVSGPPALGDCRSAESAALGLSTGCPAIPSLQVRHPAESWAGLAPTQAVVPRTSLPMLLP